LHAPSLSGPDQRTQARQPEERGLEETTNSKIKGRETVMWPTKSKHVIVALASIVCVVVFGLCLKYLLGTQGEDTTHELFRKHILDPIPTSVAGLRAAETKLPFGYAYRFKVGKNDLAAILSSASFDRLSHVTYENGRLHFWQEPNVGMLAVAVQGPSWSSAPKWLKPQLWDHPQVYGFVKEEPKREIAKTIIYNENEQEAYFFALITKEETWPGPRDYGKW